MFLASLLEAIPFVGLLVPGQLAVIFAGILAQRGLLRLDLAIASAIVGALIGQAIGYYAGRRIGRPLLERFGPRFKITSVEVARTEALFRKWGHFAVFIGNFSFLTRGLANLMAGISRYPAYVFFPVTGVAVVVWAVGYTVLGFVAGEAYRLVSGVIGAAALGVVVLLLGLWIWFTVRKVRRAPRP